jgi:hypothetical protein
MNGYKKYILSLALALVFATAAFSVFVYFDKNSSSQSGRNEAAMKISNEQSRAGEILGEEGSASSADALRFFESQSFRSPAISLGGEAVVYPGGGESKAPEISDLRSELLVSKNEKDVKFLVSWKTNKLCQSSIEFQRGGEASGKSVSEDGYGYVHSAELSPLNFSTTYSYAVTARDKWGNETKSDKLAFYTGAPSVSIFDLLGGAFKDMFGWANKR